MVISFKEYVNIYYNQSSVRQLLLTDENIILTISDSIL